MTGFEQLQAGQILGRYELLMPVGRGGMAQVWAARMRGSRGFQKIVAIKVMLPFMMDDAQFEKMFLDEATLASQVRHPHVIEILDLGEEGHLLYLVMEWVDGEPLNVILRSAASRGGVPMSIAVNIMMQACRGLHAAHELRNEAGELVELVHRDISPQNILVSYDGVVKIVDFGVAKATSRISAETEAGHLKGKVAYMSPEQVSGLPIDRRTDIFAMGILLYMLTTGRHPLKGDNDAATVANIMSEAPVAPPSAFVQDYPENLERIVLRALDKDRGRRFETANDLLKALSRALPSSLPVSTDEEVASFIRALLPDHLMQRKAAIAAALNAVFTDRQENAHPSAPEMYADGLAGALRQDTSATGAGTATLETQNLAPEVSARRRTLWWGALAGLGLVVAGGFFWASSTAPARSEVDPLVAVEAPVRRAVSAQPDTDPKPEMDHVPPAAEEVVLDAGADAAPAAAQSVPTRTPIRRTSRNAAPKAPTSPTAPRSTEPFISPVRSPGF